MQVLDVDQVAWRPFGLDGVDPAGRPRIDNPTRDVGRYPSPAGHHSPGVSWMGHVDPVGAFYLKPRHVQRCAIYEYRLPGLTKTCRGPVRFGPKEVKPLSSGSEICHGPVEPVEDAASRETKDIVSCKLRTRSNLCAPLRGTSPPVGREEKTEQQLLHQRLLHACAGFFSGRRFSTRHFI